MGITRRVYGPIRGVYSASVFQEGHVDQWEEGKGEEFLHREGRQLLAKEGWAGWLGRVVIELIANTLENSSRRYYS